MEKIYLIGAGGYVKTVLDSMNHYLYDFQGFIDDFHQGSHLGYPTLGKNLAIIKDLTCLGHNIVWYNYIWRYSLCYLLRNFIDRGNNITI